jgi:hypothetical protein
MRMRNERLGLSPETTACARSAAIPSVGGPLLYGDTANVTRSSAPRRIRRCGAAQLDVRLSQIPLRGPSLTLGIDFVERVI